MNRFTEKVSNGVYSTTDYLLKDLLKIDTDNPDEDYIRRTQKAVISKLADKLGKYEDGGDLVFENIILTKLSALNKKREALEKQFQDLKDNWNSDTAVSLVELNNDENVNKSLDILEQALLELQAIKEAKPSEALEQIKTLRGFNLVELNNETEIKIDLLEEVLYEARGSK